MQTQCPICNRLIKLDDYGKHHKRCSSIKYIEIKTGSVNYDELYKMSDTVFLREYYALLHKVYDTSDDEFEKRRLENILFGANHQLKDCIR